MPDLETMIKAEIIEYGESMGIEGLSDRMTKAELIKTVQEEL